MAAGYFQHGVNHTATFELFVRALPPNRSYLIVAGVEQVLTYLSRLRFHEEEIRFLQQHPIFRHVPPAFFDYLRTFRFRGEVWGIPEGNLVFAEEPILRVTAPVIEAQIVETFLLSMINFQTLIATKASRVVWAAGKDGKRREVADFGSRRAHGPEAGVLAARASYIGGCTSTSNTYAGMFYQIPISGTMAHSWVMSFNKEEEAFRAFHQSFPEATILLIDTYDTEAGAHLAVQIGPHIRGVRIDSGNAWAMSRKVRAILDRAGLTHVKIVVSGDLNEYLIQDLVDRGAPIDFFGVGTEMVTSKDAPALGGVYKLVEQEEGEKRRYRAKFSVEKATYPGKKQVFRFLDGEGRYVKDLIARENEVPGRGAIPLLVPLMKGGEQLAPSPSLPEIQQKARDSLSRLPEVYRRLDNPRPYPVYKSQALEALFQQVQQEQRAFLKER
ncbi:MAG: nicotinate phosphoribosyltransferase [Nitrospinota bacterium]|nr:MAG: nicotinate phosphoribosyltransferase [Nitrospinota bacterium]